MTVRVEVAPAVLRWARERSSVAPERFSKNSLNVDLWESGDRQPTLKQLEKFAAVTNTPIGQLLLPEPPTVEVPIPDLRTIGSRGVLQPSQNLIAAIEDCERRQDWYHTYARQTRLDPVDLVASCTTETPTIDAAALLHSNVAFDVTDRGNSWTDALTVLREEFEGLGILVMMSGVIGSNTSRPLDVEEFRGFALSDPLAPVVFVNAADSKAAQLFTLAHEVAHLLLGASAISDISLDQRTEFEIERWCNRVAAEFLVPADQLARFYDASDDLHAQVQQLARWFRTSTLTVLRRLFEGGYLDWDRYRAAYDEELTRGLAIDRPKSSGGDFYNTQPVRVSKRFARAVIESTLEGNTLYTEAFNMLGFRRLGTFDKMSEKLGVT